MKTGQPNIISTIAEKQLKPIDNLEYGFTKLQGLLNDDFKGFTHGISIVEKLNDSIIDEIEEKPTASYLNHHLEKNEELNGLTKTICKKLEMQGIRCIAITPSISVASNEFKPYLEELRYKFSHKQVAIRSGLGWIGKTDLFVSKRFGPRVKLTSILVDKPIEPLGTPIVKSRCGSCNICVKACPAQAANGHLWDINTNRDYYFDAQKCMKKCEELAKAHLNINGYVCGKCLSVCPVGKKTHI